MALDTTFLRASDGTGDASLMHVTTNRLVGSTTLLVDTLVGVPQKFIGVTGALNASGFVTPASITKFYGHIDTGHLVIDGFLPGSTDVGNTAGQVVVIKPNTDWANLVATVVDGFAQGWFAPLNTWVYVSATTFKITGVDVTAIYKKGTRVRFKQGGSFKYGVVSIDSTFSTDTTVTLYNTNAYNLTNVTITEPGYAYTYAPVGLPSFFWQDRIIDLGTGNQVNSNGGTTYTIVTKTITLDIDSDIQGWANVGGDSGSGTGSLFSGAIVIDGTSFGGLLPTSGQSGFNAYFMMTPSGQKECAAGSRTISVTARGYNGAGNLSTNSSFIRVTPKSAYVNA